MQIRVLAAAVFGAVFLGTVPALACTPSADQAQIEKAYYRSVTSVYRVVAEDFVPVDPRFPTDNFSVRLKPDEAIWGQRPPKPFTLTFTAGMCNGWFFESLEQGETLNGKEYFVFFAPLGRERPAELRIMPAGHGSAAAALVMLGRLQASGGGAPRAEDASLPRWPSSVAESAEPTRLWLDRFRWPVTFGSALVLFLIGFALGRAFHPRRTKIH